MVSRGTTTIAAFVGSSMRPSSPLLPHYSPNGMRARRRPIGNKIGVESRGRYGFSAPPLFENYDSELGDGNSSKNKPRNAADNITVSDDEPFLPVLTSTIERDDGSTVGNNSTMTTTALSSEEYSKDRDNYFSTTNTIQEEMKDPGEEEGRRLAMASERLIRFLREEAPPTSIILLNFVAIIWGSQHAIIKTVVDDCDPAAFTFLRFGLASLIAAPYLPGVKQTVMTTTKQLQSFGTDEDGNDAKEEIDLWTPWRWGMEMGLWMFLGFSLQAIGLQTTTAQRSGFLLYLNVKFVPFFAKVILGREISKWTWLSAFAAFSGTALLALDGQSLGLNVGDIWSVMAAAASAMFILRLEKASSEVENSSELNSTSLAVVAMLSGAWLLLGNNGPQIAVEVKDTAFAHPLELLYLGAISTALANFIQAKAQKDVPAERASIIYSLDPVYGAFFSWIILGETLGGPQAYIGASIIFVAAATNSLLEFSKGEERKE